MKKYMLDLLFYTLSDASTAEAVRQRGEAISVANAAEESEQNNAADVNEGMDDVMDDTIAYGHDGGEKENQNGIY